MKKRSTIAWIVAVVVLAAVAGLLAATHGARVPDEDAVSLAAVRRGDLKIRVYSTGELQATHAMILIAPPVSGGALQITRLLHTGMAVKKGDIVFEFDPSEQLYNLEQNRSELLQAEQEIAKAVADAAVQAAEDKVALLKARFDLRRAELEVQKNELVSSIDAKKNDLALEQSRQALTQLQQDIQSHTASGQATIFLAQEKKNKARLAMDQAQHNIERMRVAAPMDGLVSIERNSNALGGIMWQGMSLPDYRAGDQVQPGSAIAQVIDPSQMEVRATIGEQERNNVKAGQPAEIEFNALPGVIFHGTIKNVGGMSMRPFWEANMGGKFDISIQLDHEDPRLRPGLTAQVKIVGDEKKNVLYIPRLALFMRNGKRAVYVKSGNGFEQREVTVQAENESSAAVGGLRAGEKVALLDPTAPKKSPAGAGTPAAGVGP